MDLFTEMSLSTQFFLVLVLLGVSALVIWIRHMLHYIHQQKKLFAEKEYYLSFPHVSGSINAILKEYAGYWHELKIEERERKIEWILSYINSWIVICKQERIQLKRHTWRGGNISDYCIRTKSNNFALIHNFLVNTDKLMRQQDIPYQESLEDTVNHFIKVLHGEEISFKD